MILNGSRRAEKKFFSLSSSPGVSANSAEKKRSSADASTVHRDVNKRLWYLMDSIGKLSHPL